MSEKNLITILGPTASGKTSFGAHLAYHIDGEIISADSRQVYRDMDIGTGKDYDDYLVNEVRVPVHLIDIRDPGYRYNVFEYQKDFFQAFNDIREKEKMPLLVGGSGMYLQAVLDRYQLIHVPVNKALREKMEDKDQEELVEILKRFDTRLHNVTDTKHRKRTIRAIEIADYYSRKGKEEQELPKLDTVVLGIKVDRENRRKRISERLKARIEEGMVDEVKRLLEKINEEDLLFYGLEYKFITLYLKGELKYNEMFRQLETAIHQFAKRQMTWFRRMEKMGWKIHWINGNLTIDQKLKKAYNILKENNCEIIKKWTI